MLCRMVRGLCSAVLAVLMGLVACSSGSGTPATGGSGSCESLCDKAASLNCANYTAQQCASECQGEFSEYTNACPSEVSSYFGCLQQQPLRCGTDGEPEFVNEDAISSQCGAQVQALSACAACVPSSTDSTCDTCTKQNCCTEMKRLYGDPAVLQLSNCLAACPDGDSACQQACMDQYPSPTENALALNECEQTKCGC